MSNVRSFLRLTPAERAFFLRALMVVGVVRLGLTVLPFRKVHRVVCRRSERALHRARSLPGNASLTTERIVWIVQAASARVPHATCLTRALAAQWLLAERGHPSEVSIGVARAESEAFAAHAWLTCEGAELGTAERDRYTPIATIAVR